MNEAARQRALHVVAGTIRDKPSHEGKGSAGNLLESREHARPVTA
jgi:hypothetical protein